MEDPESWTIKSNKAIKVMLVRAGREKRQTQVIGVFAPKHTYEIFSENEEIIGYRDLKIVLQYACFDLYPHVDISWREKDKMIEEGGEQDVMTMMKTWLPAIAFEPKAKLLDHLEEHRAGKWTPPGRRLASYRYRNRVFEIWHGQLSDPKVRALLNNMQIFATFFIEGGSYVNLQDPEWTLQRWSVFLLYEKTNTKISQPPYELIGYCTTYRFWLYLPVKQRPTVRSMDDPLLPPQMSSARDLPCRERISQFVILPPNQRQGHGARFYEIMVETFIKDPSVHEITVEDPNEAFDDLRDFSDLVRLRQNPTFARLRIDTSVPLAPNSGRLPTAKLLPRSTLDELRRSHKIAQRQFDRLVEMQLLSLVLAKVQRVLPNRRKDVGRNPQTATGDERHYFLWRLLVKQRLYKRNVDVLAQLDLPERKLRLEDAMQDQEKDYIRILGGVARWQASRDKLRAEQPKQSGVSPTSAKQGILPSVENDESSQTMKVKKSSKKLQQGDPDDDKDEENEAEDDTENSPEKKAKRRLTLTERGKGKSGDEDHAAGRDDGKNGEGNSAEDPLTLSSSPPPAKRTKLS